MNAYKQKALQKNKDLNRNNATLYRSFVYTVTVLLLRTSDALYGLMHKFQISLMLNRYVLNIQFLLLWAN